MGKLDNLDWVAFLGEYIGSASIDELLAALDIKKIPKRKRDLADIYLEAKTQGIVLIFSLESSFDTQIEYPEDALVLVNITFYLQEQHGYKKFDAKMPFNLKNSMNLSEIVHTLGAPDSQNNDLQLLKWNKNKVSVFVNFNDNQDITNVAIQLQGA